jgi:hypothetical protein
MKRTAIKLFFAVSVLALAGFLNAGAANAETCESLCNQIKRACKAEAKYAAKSAFGGCDLARMGCDMGCADPNTPECVPGCASDPNAPECPQSCRGCCSYERDSCRHAVKEARKQARDACVIEREGCVPCEGDVCGDCAKTAKSAARECKRTAKQNWRGCKDDCPRGPERRNDRKECITGCRQQLAAALETCADAEGLTLQGCDDPNTPCPRP